MYILMQSRFSDNFWVDRVRFRSLGYIKVYPIKVVCKLCVIGELLPIVRIILLKDKK